MLCDEDELDMLRMRGRTLLATESRAAESNPGFMMVIISYPSIIDLSSDSHWLWSHHVLGTKVQSSQPCQVDSTPSK